MSDLRVTNLRGRIAGSAPQLPDGAVVTGVVTATSLSVEDITATGNVSIAGTLTYEDVTNVDSIGIITARSDISIADKIIHTGDTDTAIRFPTADTFTVETGGSERVRVTSDGSVGIGTDIPNANLEVASVGISTLRIYSNNDIDPIAALELKRGINPIFGADNRFDYRFKVVLGELLIDRGANGIGRTVFQLNTARQLGIGTAPLGRVHIFSNVSGITTSGQIAANADELILESAAQTGMTFASPNTGGAYINFTDPDDKTPGQILYDHTDNYLRVKVNDGERLRIVSTGYVGVGRTDPAVELDVAGGLRFAGEALENINITAGTLSANQNINLTNGMVHYFTSNETGISTPNIRINPSTSLDSVMDTGNTAAVTILTTPNNAGYSTCVNIDGSYNVVQWLGGAAPSAGGASGIDAYTYQIIKTGSATFTVLGSVNNFA